MKRMNKYFFINREKEAFDTQELAEKIKKENWIDQDTIIVNCSPDYSSSLSMIMNHKLSHLNENELFAKVGMEMPYPNMNQVWNERMEPQLFDLYLKDWNKKYLNKSNKYLFLNTSTLRGKNFNKIKLTIKEYLEPESYRFASLYVQSSSIFKPDYFVEEFDFNKQGGLLFWWENESNPNWNY